MEPFVPTVILGLGGTPPFQIDPQRHPPRRQPAQPVQGLHAGKGGTVIGANRFGQAITLKDSLKGFSHTLRTCVIHRTQLQYIAAELITDGQGLASATFSPPPPALEVYGPHLVRALPLAPAAQPPSFLGPFAHSARLG